MSTEKLKITLHPSQARNALVLRARKFPIPEDTKEVAYLGCDCFGPLGEIVLLCTREQATDPAVVGCCPDSRWAPINEPVKAGDRVVVLRRLSQGRDGVGEIRTVDTVMTGGSISVWGEASGPLIADRWVALGPEDSGPVDRKGVLLAVGDQVIYHDRPTFRGVERPELDLQVFTVMAIRKSARGYVAELDDTSATIHGARAKVFTQRLERTGGTGETPPTTGEEDGEDDAASKDAMSNLIDLLVKAVGDELAAQLDSGEARIIEVFDIDTPEEKSYYAKLPDGWHEVDPRVCYQDGADVVRKLGRNETYGVLG